MRCTLLVVLLLASPASRAAPAASILVEPAEVRTDLSFDGATVSVVGSVLEGQQVAVLCRGHGTDLALKRKGKVAGILWMNVGEVHFNDLPSLYLLSTSAPLARLAPPQRLVELGLGFDAVEAHSASAVPPGQRPALVQQLVALKEHEGLFAIHEGTVRLGRGAAGTTLVRAECRLPASTRAGDYEVVLYGFKDGRGQLLGSAPLRVAPRGLCGLIASVVERRPLLHGLLAVVIAIVAGLACGIVFGRGGHKAH